VTTEDIVDFSKIKKTIDSFDHCIIAPMQDKQFWEKVSQISDAPVVFKVLYMPFSMSTVEYIGLFLKTKLLEIPGVICVNFSLFETPTQGTNIF
jgi:hypothetical protein